MNATSGRTRLGRDVLIDTCINSGRFGKPNAWKSRLPFVAFRALAMQASIGSTEKNLPVHRAVLRDGPYHFALKWKIAFQPILIRPTAVPYSKIFLTNEKQIRVGRWQNLCRCVQVSGHATPFSRQKNRVE